MLQNKIEAVVHELCEEGVQDQDTILVSKHGKTIPNSDEQSSRDKDESNDLGGSKKM